MIPHALNVCGSTQPEVFEATVATMARMMKTNHARFWRDSVKGEGPIELWEINGARFIYNGNHRYHAAVRAGEDIPDDALRSIDKTGTNIPTFLLADLDWLPGFK